MGESLSILLANSLPYAIHGPGYSCLCVRVQHHPLSGLEQLQCAQAGRSAAINMAEPRRRMADGRGLPHTAAPRGA